MLYTTKTGKSFDTQKDLTAAERHILQKLFGWEAMAASIEQFYQKREEALQKGWNHSGPVRESPALKMIIDDLARKVRTRLSPKTTASGPR